MDSFILSDGLNNEKSQKEALKLEFKYEYEKKATADSIRNIAAKKLAQTKSEHEATQRYILYAGIFLTFIFALFMFNRFRITRKQRNTIHDQKLVVELQKELVEQQKHIVEEKQREVMSSIEYAKRIQHALLPSEKYIDKNLKRLK